MASVKACRNFHKVLSFSYHVFILFVDIEPQNFPMLVMPFIWQSVMLGFRLVSIAL